MQSNVRVRLRWVRLTLRQRIIAARDAGEPNLGQKGLA